MGRKKKNQKDEEEVKTEEKRPRFNIASDAKRSAAAVVLFMLAILIILGFFGASGVAGIYLNKTVGSLLGFAKWVLPLFLIIAGAVLFFRKEKSFYITKLSGLFIALISITAFFHWFYEPGDMADAAKAGQGGGHIGYGVTWALEKFLGNAGSAVVIVALFFIGIIVAFNFSLAHILKLLFKKAEPTESTEEAAAEQKEEKPEEKPADPAGELEKSVREPELHENVARMEIVEGMDHYVDPSLVKSSSEEKEYFNRKSIDALKVGPKTEEKTGEVRRVARKNRWMFPPLDLLEQSSGIAKGGDTEKSAQIIEKTLKDFGIDVERGGIITGPSVTQYSFRPAVGVKISKIMALQNDLSLALAAHPIRIEAPIPGKSLIGIEVPNKVSATVRLRGIFENSLFKRRESNLTIALGEDVTGNFILGDLAKMPHLLIAGATGTGKSVCINSLITTLLYQNSPQDLRFIMVDPKRVELSLYNGIPHLISGVVVENGRVINALKWAVSEMERRYRLLQDMGARDILSYKDKLKINKKIKYTDPETKETFEKDAENMPYIVIIIDELADLMGSHGKEVEGAVVRIAQMARAVGIHLIISTQRPSVEVITGLIKANITTRIAFQVATQIDSRTILDMAGSEKLLGNGDMLYLSAASPKPKRIQGALVSESEVKRVVKFIKEQKTKEQELEEDITEGAGAGILKFENSPAGGGEDELLEAAKEEITRAKKASASLLQRRLRVGYARAARLLDILEEKGLIGPADGAKPREVYISGNPEEPGYEDNIEDQEKRDKWQI
jgi:DNA segregation ATPase FtsK/SpoIIIE, S-DNA-T family